MTIKERVESLIFSDWNKWNFENDGTASIEKMIIMAYYIGREEAVKEVANMYNEHIRKQVERAGACRYHNMAREVVGNEMYLYCSDYNAVMTTLFGNDKADI